MARLFITGATGFVGKRLVRRLVAEGHDVRALARSAGGAKDLAAAGAEPVFGALDDVDAWAERLQGCDVVVHAASPISVWGDEADMRRQIVDASLAVQAAAERFGVRRMIHLSSESVLQAGPSLDGVDERFPYPAEPNSLYGRCKKAAEIGLLSQAGATEIIILRPSFIWGPGGQVETLVRKVREGGFVWIDHGVQPMEMSHVDNVVEAIALALTRGRSSEIYIIADGAKLTVREFLGALIEAFGVPAPTRSLPGWIARPAARVVEAVWSTFGLTSDPPLSRFQLDFVALPRRYSIDKAMRDLGYRPIVSVEAGLRAIREGR